MFLLNFQEDIENIAFTDDIFNECKRIWNQVCFEVLAGFSPQYVTVYEIEVQLILVFTIFLSDLLYQGNFEVDLSLLDISKYEKVREQDVCNILKVTNLR